MLFAYFKCTLEEHDETKSDIESEKDIWSNVRIALLDLFSHNNVHFVTNAT